MAKPASAASQPRPDGSELAQRLALLARLDPTVLRKLMKISDADRVLQHLLQPHHVLDDEAGSGGARGGGLEGNAHRGAQAPGRAGALGQSSSV